MFYYFIESERDADNDPLLLSLTGGPGCSAFSSLVFEFGMLYFYFLTKFSESNVIQQPLFFFFFGEQ